MTNCGTDHLETDNVSDFRAQYWYHDNSSKPEGNKDLVPRISEFFGITIYMYWYDFQKHNIPHFHARYAGREAVYDLSGNLLEGDVGQRAHRLIEEWTGERKTELQNAWKQAMEGKEVPWVSPLQ